MNAWLPWVFSAIGSSVFYQLLTKIFAGRWPLAFFMCIASATVFALSLVMFSMSDKSALPDLSQNKKILLLPIGIGIASFMIDISFYYLYKNNAPLSLARMIILAGIASVLLFIGIVFFKERFNGYQILGSALCLLGLYLIVMMKPKG